MPSVFVGSLKF